jgi:HAMP domain-containing protein
MKRFKDWRLWTKIVVPAIVLTLIVSVALGVLINGQQQQLAISQARSTAQAISQQIRADREVYTDKVLGKLKRDGFDLKLADMKSLDAAGHIPLAASFVHLTNDIVNGQGLHQADLLSLWNINPDKKPRTPFESEALEYLTTHPTESRVGVSGDGASARFYFVTADTATAQVCADCHNALPASPRKNFRLNDVMGGLVISLPLDKPFAIAKRNALVLTGSLVTVFVLMLLIVAFIQWRFISKPLVTLERAADRISLGELDESIRVTSEDEVGSLGKAFERMRLSLAAAMQQVEDDE